MPPIAESNPRHSSARSRYRLRQHRLVRRFPSAERCLEDAHCQGERRSLRKHRRQNGTRSGVDLSCAAAHVDRPLDAAERHIGNEEPALAAPASHRYGRSLGQLRIRIGIVSCAFVKIGDARYAEGPEEFPYLAAPRKRIRRNIVAELTGVYVDVARCVADGNGRTEYRNRQSSNPRPPRPSSRSSKRLSKSRRARRIGACAPSAKTAASSFEEGSICRTPSPIGVAIARRTLSPPIAIASYMP